MIFIFSCKEREYYKDMTGVYSFVPNRDLGVENSILIHKINQDVSLVVINFNGDYPYYNSQTLIGKVKMDNEGAHLIASKDVDLAECNFRLNFMDNEIEFVNLVHNRKKVFFKEDVLPSGNFVHIKNESTDYFINNMADTVYLKNIKF